MKSDPIMDNDALTLRWAKSFLADTQEIMFVKDANLVYLAVSGAFAEMVHIGSAEEVVGGTDFDFFDRALAQQYVDDDRRMMESGKPLAPYIEPLPDKDGKPRWSRTRKNLIQSENGEILGVYGVSVDITETVELQSSKSLLDSIPAAAFRCKYSVESELLVANDGFYRLCGYTREEFARLHKNRIAELLYLPDQSAFGAALEHQPQEAGNVIQAEIRIVRKDGSLCWVEVRGTPGEETNGEKTVFCLLTDITAHKEAEAQLALRDEALRYADNSLSAGTVINGLGLNTPLIYVSDNMEKLIGYTKAEFQQMYREQYKGLIHPDDFERVLRDNTQYGCNQPKHFEMQFRFVRKDGSVLWVLEKSDLLESFRGQPAYLTMFIDITLQKQVEQELNERSAMTQVLLDQSGLSLWEYEPDKDRIRQLMQGNNSHHKNLKFMDNFPYCLIEQRYIKPSSAQDQLNLLQKIKDGAPTAAADIWFAPSGRDEWCERITYVSTFDSDGKVVKSYATNQDITAEKLAEQRFKEELWRSQSMYSEKLLTNVRANLTKNVVESYLADENLSVSCDGMPYDQAIKALTAVAYTAQEQALICNKLSAKHIISEYERGVREYSLDYRRKTCDGRVLWVHTIVKIYPDVHTGDIGSGYSSLNVLKDITIDVLKIDMAFFQKAPIPGRAENIIASIVRMAKWLNLTTIAEGVEKLEQVDFLREIGCDYIQGYYFARPMPVNEYEQLMATSEATKMEQKNEFNLNCLWLTNPEIEVMFSGISQAVIITEFDGDRVNLLRANHAFYELLGYKEDCMNIENLLNAVSSAYRAGVLNAFQQASKTKNTVECEFMRIFTQGTQQWVHLSAKYISELNEASIFMVTLSDVTAQHQIEEELGKYRFALTKDDAVTNKILIVDDQEINRMILAEMFQDRYIVLQACNGKEALAVLEQNNNSVDIIMLDLMMPEMDGAEFLKLKKQNNKIAEIPVIIITADESMEQQATILNLGADDYVIKPFVKEVVLKRANNILHSRRRFREILREYNAVVERSQEDTLTGLFNRAAAEEFIRKRIAKGTSSFTMLLIDIDYFKTVNDTYGHDAGDRSLQAVAQTLKKFWRSNDVVARFGGDEFCVFTDAPLSEDAMLARATACCKAVNELVIEGITPPLSLSIGIATQSERAQGFEALYKNADLALYDAKRNGRNQAALFGHAKPVAVGGHLFEKEWLIDELDTCLFIIDCDSYDMQYVSNTGMRLLGLKSYSGKKCYELLHGRTEPCPFCIQHKLRYDTYYRWEFYNEYLKRNVLSKDKLLDMNGHVVHLQLMDETSTVEKASPVPTKT